LRVGIGFDAHEFKEGRKLILGGVEFPGEVGLAGHSDADVVVHALADALLGACGAGDIGTHFPPEDPDYEGVSSLILLNKVMDVVLSRGYRVLNADITVVCESPRISPFGKQMSRVLSKILGVEEDVISVKGTTTEGMGFTGRREGIAAIAVVLLGEEG